MTKDQQKHKERRLSKAAMQRLLKSNFFSEVISTVRALDFYKTYGPSELADRILQEWLIARSALEFITDNKYKISRNGEIYSIVNESDPNDKLYTAHSIKVGAR